VRVFCDGELSRLSTECRGFLFTLERLGILSSQQREVVIERMLALDADELDTEQLKWVVLMVLSSQPDQQQAFARLEDLVADKHSGAPH
jgi:Smg protein